MKKSIDVLFICPKNRCLVVWHQAKWWQVARMDLTETSWQRRKAYTGSLEDIFVAKRQVNDVKGLNLVVLPEELWGVTAAKFLGWWQLNRYQFWHAPQDEIPTDIPANPIADEMLVQNKTTADDGLNPALVKQPSDDKAVPQTPAATPLFGETSSGDDIFEALMADLTQDIRQL